MKRTIYVAALLLCAWMSGAAALQAERFQFDHEHVLGTSLGIAISCDTIENAHAAEARVLAEIERLAKIFSTYDAASELSRWQQTTGGNAQSVAPELLEVLAASDRWRAASGGAFQPGIEAASRVWREAAKLQRAPTAAQLQQAVAEVNQVHWQLDAAGGKATRLSDVPLSLDGIAKGYITERAVAAAMNTPGIRGVLLNLGGDMRVEGNIAEVIRIADPRQDAINGAPIATVQVANRAIATSGDYRRGFEVAGVWHSHIIDPRSGVPATGVASATVIAASSTDADALATLCNILTVEESLALVESTPGAAALIVTPDRRQFSTANWQEFAVPSQSQSPFRFASAETEATTPAVATAEPTAATAVKKADEQPTADEAAAKPAEPNVESKDELLELVVDFEINRPTGRRTRRPYVAVWLENADGFPVKTAVLWLQTERPGPRWHRDLSRWYRNEGNRKLTGMTPLIETIASATRGPGKYQALFDGTSDEGTPLKPGKYTLFIEAAREHGTYQLIRHEMTLGREPIADTKLKGNVEIKSASVAYRPKSAAPAPAPEK